ncbi:MAG: STAS domain-containing protein [Candidatus Muiribacteriota bacterium]
MEKITHEKQFDIIIVFISGEIDKTDEQDIKDYFENLLNKNVKKIIINAGKITYLGSSTLGIFSRLHQKASTKGAKMVFAELSPFTKKIFKITTFDKYFNIKYSVKDAVEYFKQN